MSHLKEEQFHDTRTLIPFMKRIFSYATSHKKWFTFFMAAVILVGVCDALFPLLWKYFIDDFILPTVTLYKDSWAQGIQPAINYMHLAYYAGLFLLLGCIQVVGVYFFITYAGLLEETVMYQLRGQMFEKLQKLSFSYYDKSATGWLLSRISSDASRVTQLISWGFLDVIWGFTMIIFCLSFMFYYNWKLTLIVVVSIPILMFISVKIRIAILKYARQARKVNSELTASYSENINGLEVNKITSQEDRVTNEFMGLSNNMRHSSFKAAYYTAMYLPLVIFMGSMAASMILYFGGIMTVSVPAGLTIGTLAAFFTYATQIFWPILNIARFYASAQSCLSAGERVFSLIDEVPAIQDKEGATDFENIKGDIHFENVDFHYIEDKPIYQDFNLHIKAGQSIALVGETGGGKSTVTNLICRFYEASAGRVLIDGEDILDKTRKSLREQLGIVMQTPHLFSGTILENIKYARQSASKEEVEKALTIVGAADFIQRLEEEVGGNGDSLSMGEKQLISFARAILTNPRILIMDEATSSIDTLTEAAIQEGISQMIQGRTAIIIAHRLSTIKNCDRILVIRKGAIVEDGSHQELIAKEGYYYQLYTGDKKIEFEVKS